MRAHCENTRASQFFSDPSRAERPRPRFFVLFFSHSYERKSYDRHPPLSTFRPFNPSTVVRLDRLVNYRLAREFRFRSEGWAGGGGGGGKLRLERGADERKREAVRSTTRGRGRGRLSIGLSQRLDLPTTRYLRTWWTSKLQVTPATNCSIPRLMKMSGAFSTPIAQITYSCDTRNQTSRLLSSSSSSHSHSQLPLYAFVVCIHMYVYLTYVVTHGAPNCAGPSHATKSRENGRRCGAWLESPSRDRCLSAGSTVDRFFVLVGEFYPYLGSRNDEKSDGMT